MQSAADPVGSGFVTSLARPDGNVTGMSILSTELAAKRLQLMQELVSGSRRIGLLAVDNRFATPLLVEAMRTASRQLQIDLILSLVKVEAELPRAFETLNEAGARSLIVQTSPFAAARREMLAALATRHQLPAMYETRDYVDAGGLISYGPDGRDLMRRAARFVDKILKGARPGDLPIELPAMFNLAINLQAARALRLTVPATLLVRADVVLN